GYFQKVVDMHKGGWWLVAGHPPRVTSHQSLLSALGRRGFDRLAEGRLVRVHPGEPPVGIGHLAVDHVEERPLNRLGDRTAVAVAHLNLVDRSDRRDLSRGPD